MSLEKDLSVELERILERSALDPELRKALGVSLKAIAERQDALGRAMQEKLARERAGLEAARRREIRVTTALAEISRLPELKAYGFFEIPIPKDETRYFANISSPLFLKTGYAESRRLCQSGFTGSSGGSPVEYELRPFYGYADAERLLDLLWRIYGFSSPRPWSPWARRAVYLWPVGATTPRAPDETLDMRLVENDLVGKVLEGMTLVWNVEIKPGEKAATKRIRPDAVGKRYSYYYAAKDLDDELWALPKDVETGRVAPETSILRSSMILYYWRRPKSSLVWIVRNSFSTKAIRAR